MDTKRMIELLMESMKLSEEYETFINEVRTNTDVADIDEMISTTEKALVIMKKMKKTGDEVEKLKLDLEEKIYRDEHSS
jgi:hypothetical protein